MERENSYMEKIKLSIHEDFFIEEERDGFQVCSDIKKVWAIELDLLNEFQRVCTKYGFTYFADGGTMLGAIRHKGFIPWDDDIDIIMMRDQYEQLCNVAKEEFKEPYFFQTEYSDPSSLRGHAQLRNSSTTGILRFEAEKKYSFNQGIFIDIFPLDAVPQDRDLFEEKINNANKYLSKARSLSNLTDRYVPANGKNPLKKAVKSMAHCLFSGPLNRFADYDKYYKLYETECAKYNNQKTEKVAKYFCIPFHRGQIWYREDFEKCIMMPFEMLEIPVPVGYKRIMDTFFGEDWMTPKKTPTLHSGVLFDTDKSYLEYLSQK